MSLTFEAATHTYRFGGLVVPSVTQILKIAGLIDYSMIPADVLQVAAARGTAVHKACELYDQEDLDESSLTDEIRAYLDSYKLWLQHTGFQPALIESRVWHPQYQYAGTLDRTGVFPDGRLAVVDFKTGIKLPGHEIQLAAYAMTQVAAWKMDRITLYLQYDGSLPKADHHYSDTLDEHFSVFLSALTTTNWKLSKGLIQL